MIVLQNMYNDLVSNVTHLAVSRNLPQGSTLYRKKIGNTEYWYAKDIVDGRNLYIGKASDNRTIKILQSEEHIKNLEKESRVLVKSLRANGMPAPSPVSSKIIIGLANAGFFRLRGVLIGTLAFQTYLPMLGIMPDSRASSTMDVDFAQDQRISLVIAKEKTINFDRILQTCGNFQRKINMMDEQMLSFWKDVDTGLEVDLVAPLGFPWDQPVSSLPALEIKAERLKFLDFLLKDELEAAVLYGSGIAINVPTPERFAIHKLIVGAERKNPAKSRKDFMQSQILIQWFLENDPERIKEAYAEAFKTGPGWRSRLKKGLNSIKSELAGILNKEDEQKLSSCVLR